MASPWGVAPACRPIAADDSAVYWVDAMGGTVTCVGVNGGAVTTLASGLMEPGGIALNASDVFWSNSSESSNGTVLSESTAGGAITTLASSQTLAQSFAADDVNVYWADSGSGKVMQASQGGANVITLASGDQPTSIAVSTTNVYWLNTALSTDLVTVPIGGGAVTTIASELGPVYTFALRGSSALWWDGGTLLERGLAGGSVVTLTTGQNTPFNLATDSTSVYWTTYTDTGTVVRLVLP